MRRTPLYDAHRAAGAKLAQFAGWEMPLHYGSQIEEHHAVRRDAGVFDTSHMLPVDVEGAQAAPFLRRALANDIGRLHAPGKALYSCLLAEDGGILDDLIVYFIAAGRYRMVLNAATADADVAWLETLRPAGADGHAASWRCSRCKAPAHVKSIGLHCPNCARQARRLKAFLP